MDWDDWIGKIVFIKLVDGQIFTYSKVIAFEEPFISITDRDGLPAVFNISQVIKIKEESK